MSFTQYLSVGREGFFFCPLILGDGTSLSVQGSAFSYSFPREVTLPVEAYTAFEVWFEGIENCPEFEGYCGGGGVGAYVPKEVIQAFIDSRGGVVAT